jgi:hypothetical protein
MAHLLDESSPVVIRTEALCPSCGYNLFTQPVTRDPRLQILVCRCPECGRHSPAGFPAEHWDGWMQAKATAWMTLWVLVVLHLVVLATTAVAVMPANAAIMARWLWLHRPETCMEAHLQSSALSLAAGFAFVATLVIAFPRLPRRLIWGALLLPMLAAIGAGARWPRLATDTFSLSEVEALGMPLPVHYLGGSAVLIALGMMLGICFARPAARGLLRIALPRRALPAASLLWLVDGKTLPRPEVIRRGRA